MRHVQVCPYSSQNFVAQSFGVLFELHASVNKNNDNNEDDMTMTVVMIMVIPWHTEQEILGFQVFF
jgi:hypothetical protein